MTAIDWHWEVLDRCGTPDAQGCVTCWGSIDEQPRLASEWADMRVAALMYRFAPCWDLLAGWRVRVWSERLGVEVVAEADDWLETLHSAPEAHSFPYESGVPMTNHPRFLDAVALEQVTWNPEKQRFDISSAAFAEAQQ